MPLRKFRPQNLEVVKRNQPELFAAIVNNFPELTDEQKGKIAGLCIEFVVVSGGDSDVFIMGDDVQRERLLDEESTFADD